MDGEYQASDDNEQEEQHRDRLARIALAQAGDFGAGPFGQQRERGEHQLNFGSKTTRDLDEKKDCLILSSKEFE